MKLLPSPAPSILLAVLTLLRAGPPDASAASTAKSAATSTGDRFVRRCATPDPSPDEMRQCRRALQAARLDAGTMLPGTIPLAIHVLTCGSDGNVDDGALADQVAELNRAYAPTGLRFEIASVERVDRCTWHRMTPGSDSETEAKRALAVDPYRRLNLYIADPGDGLLGWAYFPAGTGPADIRDGVVIHYRSLPGGGIDRFDLGKTAVHEVGHYLGLYHTFQNGCDNPGDEVDDTPAEASPASGCPSGRNTCPSPGVDPIHNYMDYTDDACGVEFTAGQMERMQQVLGLYRNVLVGRPLASLDPRTLPTGGPASTGSETFTSRLARRRLVDPSPGVELEGAIPNPISQNGVIRITLPERASLTLRLRDMRDRVVAVLARGRFEAGVHEFRLDSVRLRSGLYTIELESKGSFHRRTVLVERQSVMAHRE